MAVASALHLGGIDTEATKMRDTQWQWKYLQVLAALLVAAGEALAQEKQEDRPAERRIVI